MFKKRRLKFKLNNLTAADVLVLDIALSYIQDTDHEYGVLVTEVNRVARDELHDQILAIKRGNYI